jgi:hypothetical protein
MVGTVEIKYLGWTKTSTTDHCLVEKGDLQRLGEETLTEN